MTSNIKLNSSLLAFFICINFSFAQEWNLVWEDNFESQGAINSENWFHQTLLPNGYSWYNSELQHYTNRIENSYVEDGLLKIVAIKEPFTDQGHTKSYTSARLNSKFSFKYGKIEIRAKLPYGQGTWPAIWTLGKDIIEPGGYWTESGFGTSAWPACGEIDIMEHWGSNQNFVQSATHTPSSYGGTINHGGQWISTASSQHHTYGLEWTEEKLVFSVDDVVHYTYNPPIKNSNTWPFDAEQYLILNIAISPDISPNFVQSALEIDYVRVYQTADQNTGGSSDISGCTDPNAVNYNSNASIQAVDQYDNMLCTYTACNQIPSQGCMYTNAFAPWHEFFNASDCSNYGGTPCDGGAAIGIGCIDINATNYNIDASIQAEDQYGNLVCTYASCNQVPSEGCMYIDAFAPWNQYFNAADCSNYGGTPCEGEPEVIEGCMDVTALNYTANATIEDNTCEYPCEVNWNIIVTDQNHSIFIDGPWININGNPLAEGSIIGVFYQNEDGILGCAGYTTIAEGIAQISVMGDDTTTEGIDGLIAGQQFTYRIWDASSCEEYGAVLTYLNGPETYTSNGISFVNSVTGTAFGSNAQTIELPEGWFIFSSHMIPENVDIASVLSPILENIIIAKDYLGLAYLPEWNFNGIGDMKVGEGYQIKMNVAADLTIVGVQILPEESTIEFIAGWSILGYLRAEAAPVNLVLASLVADGNLIIVKNSNGLAYLPQWDFNGIGTMNPGEGYQIKTNTSGIFEYLANHLSY